ncbi:AAA family ATPase [Paraphoma chrysanthemicola]|uniref:AAA family ATPase n=1 Tax=Paraphoma chrysanthemicola TaxID=798071 RepID=A0A8K0RFU4_9PLEO|nr:AAA family ATPase [Paraphoma chrysanthemicola]
MFTGEKRARDTSNGDDHGYSDYGLRPEEQGPTKRVHLSGTISPSTPSYVIIHRVVCDRNKKYHQQHESTADFVDIPRLPTGANRMTALHGQQRILDLEDHLEDHGGLHFAVFMTYSCIEYHNVIKHDFKRLPIPEMDENIASQARPFFYVLQQIGKEAKEEKEIIMLFEDLRKALRLLQTGDADSLTELIEAENLEYPYLQLYHQKSLLTDIESQAVTSVHREHINGLYEYLDYRVGPEYAEAEMLFKMGLVNKKHWTKLYRPGAVVATVESGQPVAYICEACPVQLDDALQVRCWTWEFDGKFVRKTTDLYIPWPSDNDNIAIHELQVYPLEYADHGLEDELRARGRIFWQCRSRKFISYHVPRTGIEIQAANLRYMVDAETYKLMHSEEEPPSDRIELEDSIMNAEDPPPEPFSLLLPSRLRGYGFHNKKWNWLLVKHIQDIPWDKSTFDHRLVLPEEKKELIRALITVHIGKTEVKSDFMEGKGEGLIILLHGGPGTGKTLTAESVAELAGRPLYRVTCGDIGTDPESVEKYLESVLFIGSTWGCVVLLDEADVFLEERTKMDMQRNALVSVFLRVLEYYDGILILTTNRIGTFDEAFKSRVQLALHYPPLDEDSRYEIWLNLMQALSDSGENPNFDDIRKKLRKLAQYSLNGRQIRNTVNNARQLARFHNNEALRYAHIEKALHVTVDFEKYVSVVHGHEDEEYAREMGNR